MMSPTNPGHSVTKNSNINQKMFLLEIVGGVVFVLLVLLCLLLHYFRRKCSKPHQLFKKLRLPSTLRGAKKNQSTSTSYLSLAVSRSDSEFSDGSRQPESSGRNEVVMVDVHVNKECAEGEAGIHTPVLQHTYNEVVMVDVHVNKECAEGEADMHTPVLQHTYSTSQEFSPREESLFHKENDLSHTSLENMTSFFINSMKSLEKTEGYGSPDKEDHRHSFSARSLFEKEGQAKFQAELSSPHSQQQMQPQQLAAQAVSQQHLQEVGAGDWKPQSVAMSESVSIPASLNDASLAQMNSEVQLLTEKALLELGGGKPLPHPRAWFVSLDGRSNAHVRHSYIDLQRAGRNGINNFSLDYGMNELKQKGQMYPQKDLDEVDQSGSECGTAVCSPEDNTPRCVLEGGRRRRRGGQLPSLQGETIKRSVERPSKPSPSTELKITGHHEADCDGYDNEDDQREDKKTPWERREERPVLMFTLK